MSEQLTYPRPGGPLPIAHIRPAALPGQPQWRRKVDCAERGVQLLAPHRPHLLPSRPHQEHLPKPLPTGARCWTAIRIDTSQCHKRRHFRETEGLDLILDQLHLLNLPIVLNHLVHFENCQSSGHCTDGFMVCSMPRATLQASCTQDTLILPVIQRQLHVTLFLTSLTTRRGSS